VQEERSASEGGPYRLFAGEFSPCEKWGSAAEELFEEEAGEAAGVVAEDAVFLEEIVEDDAEAELLEGGKIDGHGLGTPSRGNAGPHRARRAGDWRRPNR